MRTSFLTILIVTSGIATSGGAFAADPPRGDVQMSAGLRDLFRAEMRALTGGVQAIAVALPAADWKSISAAATQMRDSYVLNEELTPAQRAELERLPEQFRMMDEGFHARTEKLAEAAAARDGEAVAFQLSRLLETCVACHATFAKSRFPEFSSAPSDAHRH